MAAQEFSFDVEADRKAAEKLGDGHRFETVHQGDEPRFSTSTTGAGAGLTTDTPAYEEARRQQIESPTPEPDAQSELERLREEAQYLRSKLGEQGSQMGELTRKAAEAEMLRARMDAIERGMMGQRQTIDPASIDLFQGIAPDQSYMSEAEKTRINRSMVALAQAMQQQLESIRNESNYNAVRAAAGVSEAEEAAITSQHPWVNSLSGKDRAAAIVEMANRRAREQAQPQKSAVEAARGAARGVAYVESPSRVSNAPAESLEPAMEKLSRDIKAGKFKSAEDIKKALRRIGIGQQDEYGRIT